MNTFSFLDPLFRYIDSGKLFRQPLQFLYYAFGVLMALLCIYGLVELYDKFRYADGIIYVYLILMTIVCVALAVFTVIFWFRRAGDLIKDMPENARFQAIPAVSNFLITWGEWIGIVGAVFTFCAFILSAIILSWSNYHAGEAFLSSLGGAIVGPVIFYLILLFFRLIGEQILAIGVIANNVKRIAHNTDKH